MFNSFWEIITYDIGIDLGTVNTIVYLRGRGIVLSEPSVVAINKKTKKVLAVGKEARQMIGRTPANIVAIRPLQDGVISDFDTTQAMIHYLIEKTHMQCPKFLKIPRPRVIVGVPSSVTEVERQAVLDACKTAGARQVFVVEETMAAAIGSDLPVEEASGNIIVDIGGGTSGIAVISLGDIVIDKTIKVGGDEMNQDIVSYAKQKYNMLIGDRTAEDIKIALGSAAPLDEERVVDLHGRDLLTGLPKSVEISSIEVREAIMPTIDTITQAVKDAIEETPPELISDILISGLHLSGGGALIKNLSVLWENKLKMPVKVVDEPLTAVARGTAEMLDHIELLEKIQRGWDEIS